MAPREEDYGRTRRVGSYEQADEAADDASIWPGKRASTSRLARKADGDAGLGAGARDLLSVAASSTGSPIESNMRGRLEGSLQTDLSGVRVHTGSASAEAASSIGAAAYATGQDIHFAAGQYDPSSAPGQSLLAHEVAHTVQQRGATSDVRQEKLEVSSPGDAHEVEADAFADSFMRGDAAQITPVAAGTVSRAVIHRGPGKPPINAGTVTINADYHPSLKVTPAAVQHAKLGEEFSVHAEDTSSKKATTGTVFQWRWGTVPKDSIEEGAAPAAGPSATLTAKPKKVGDVSLVPHMGAKETDGSEHGKDAPPVPVKVEPVTGQFIMTVTKGNLAPNKDRPMTGNPMKLYRNDTLNVSCFLANVNDAKAAGVKTMLSGVGNQALPDAKISGHKVEWAWKLAQPGVTNVTFGVRVPGMPDDDVSLNEDIGVKVVMDFTDLVTTCQLASGRMHERYFGASKQLDDAVDAYSRAKKAHDAGIKDANAAKELIGELLMGAFFAALGGAAGGAVGNIIKSSLGKPLADAALGGALTDGGKDVVKYLTKSLQKIGGDAKGPPPAGGTGVAGTAQGGGEGGVGVDPIAWGRGISSKLNGQANQAQKLYNDILAKARDADRDQDFDDFEGDPVAAIDGDKVITALEGVSTNQVDYAVGLWQVWLANYAYVMKTNLGVGGGVGPTAHVEDNMSSKLKKHIIEQCGGKGQGLIDTYAPQAKAAADKEATDFNVSMGIHP